MMREDSNAFCSGSRQVMSTASVPIFVINLPQSIVRRDRMEARLESMSLQAEFVTAVDGRAMSDAEREDHVDRPRAMSAGWTLSPSEIGCALSHIKIYRHMVEQRIPYAIVLEDDAMVSRDLPDLCRLDSQDCLANYVGQDDPTMIQLTHVNRFYRSPVERLASRTRKIVKPYGGVWLASGYFITLAAAKNLQNGLYPVWSVADDWSSFEKDGLVSLNHLTPNPVWADETAQVSSIEVGRSKNNKKKNRTLRSLFGRAWKDCVVRPFRVAQLYETKADEI